MTKPVSMAVMSFVLSGCTPYVLLPGNDPDSGVTCFPSQTPIGSGSTLSGSFNSEYCGL